MCVACFDLHGREVRSNRSFDFELESLVGLNKRQQLYTYSSDKARFRDMTAARIDNRLEPMELDKSAIPAVIRLSKGASACARPANVYLGLDPSDIIRGRMMCCAQQC
jgi:hypothetical protein